MKVLVQYIFSQPTLLNPYSKQKNIFLRLPHHLTESDELVSQSAGDIRCSIFKLNSAATRPPPFCRRHSNKMACTKRLRGNVLGMFIAGFLFDGFKYLFYVKRDIFMKFL